MKKPDFNKFSPKFVNNNKPFASFHGAKIFKYPSSGKEKAIKVDWKTGKFTYVNGISGRINRNGSIIELAIEKISYENWYLLKQRFSGQDYRTALPKLLLWVNNLL